MRETTANFMPKKKFESYKPIDKHLGWMFWETFGEDAKFIKNVPPRHVWTVIDGPGTRLYAVAGWHYVNRMNYIVTELPWENENEEYRI